MLFSCSHTLLTHLYKNGTLVTHHKHAKIAHLNLQHGHHVDHHRGSVVVVEGELDKVMVDTAKGVG